MARNVLNLHALSHPYLVLLQKERVKMIFLVAFAVAVCVILLGLLFLYKAEHEGPHCEG